MTPTQIVYTAYIGFQKEGCVIISTINLKGGVGKATTAIALATAAKRDGKDVELNDTDPQSSASPWAMRAEENGDPLPFSVTPANVTTVRTAERRLTRAESSSSTVHRMVALWTRPPTAQTS